jgi:hypothetical protein
MKNVQVIDGADNATFSIFRATDEEFAYLFPGPGQDIELIEDFFGRHHEDNAAKILSGLWLHPIHKSKAVGIDGTLYVDYADKRHHLPASKREIDRDPSQINSAQRELYARTRAEFEAGTSLPATDEKFLREMPGGAELIQWFGERVPSFHDAEVLGLALDREKASCRIVVHTFQVTPQVDAKGLFKFKNHVKVAFHLQGVRSLELQGFNEQNVVFGLSLSRTVDNGVRLELDPCYGLFGFVEAQAMTIELKPGKPEATVY